MPEININFSLGEVRVSANVGSPEDVPNVIATAYAAAMAYHGAVGRHFDATDPSIPPEPASQAEGC